MRNIWKYLLVGFGVFVLVFFIALPFFGGGWVGTCFAGRGMMGGYRGMMGGYGFMNPFGFFGMVLMWLIPLAILVLIVLGIAGLFKGWNIANRSNPGGGTPARMCQNCSKAAQPDWTTCPYCGSAL